MNKSKQQLLMNTLLYVFLAFLYFYLFPILKMHKDIAFILTLILGLISTVFSTPMFRQQKNHMPQLTDMLNDDFSKAYSTLEENQLSPLYTKQRSLFSEIFGMSLTAATHGEYLKTDSAQLKTLSLQVMEAIEEVSKGNTHVAELIEAISVKTNANNSFIHEIGSDVLRINQLACDAKSLAATGQESLMIQKQAVEKSTQTFSSIKEVVSSFENAALEIGSITNTISDVATKTNLLALNAAIEAARAGEAGRGFAVVADEIRKLANETNSATVRVSDLIKGIKNKVQDIVAVVENGHQDYLLQAETIESGRQVFESITEAVINTSQELGGISQKSTKLISHSETIYQAIENIAAVSQETAAGAEEVNASMVNQVTSLEIINERLLDFSSKASDVITRLSHIKFLKFAQSDYEEHIIQIEILKQLCAKHLDICIEGIRIPISELFHSISSGTTDATVAPWMPSGQANYDAVKDSITHLGSNMAGCLSGIAVPKYVDCNSITDLNQSASRFSNVIYSCYRTGPLGASMQNAINLYGLNFKIIYCNDDELLAALKKHTSKNEWVAITGWQPHSMVVSYQLKFLKDPKLAFGPENHCDTFINKKLMHSNPEIVNFLKDFKLDVNGINEALLQVNNGLSMMDAATQYIEHYYKR